MEHHLVTRPRKTPHDLAVQEHLRDLAITAIKTLLLPDPEVLRIVLIGSSVKGTFGKYDPPGFRGSCYSDFDFIVFVTDTYQISESFQRELDGKPFSDGRFNLAYRIKNLVEGKYDAEVFFVRSSSVSSDVVKVEAEQAGIPLSDESKHPFIEIDL